LAKQRIGSVIRKLRNISWLPEVISAVTLIGYSIQIWIYAHSQDSILDDGLYMLKGFLFATGEYAPFEDFGPWTNKMPLSFLIPGYVQKIFGPGLRVGRYYAIGVALIYIVGVWIIARRLGGKWGGAGALAIITLNPAPLKLYGMALSEGLIAAMLVWVLVLVLGQDRPLWQLVLGGFFAGLMPITRLNMTPVLPFVLGYIFWDHGLMAGICSTLASMLSFLGGHALFWPDIMRLWTPWFPEGLTPFLDRWRPDFGNAQSVRDINRTFRERYLSFFEGLRYHFPAIMGVITSWILWPEEWENRSQFRVTVFLSSLFTVLLILHGYASLGKDFNVFAFSVYLSFFEVLGILTIVNTISLWKKSQPKWKFVITLVFIILISLGVFYSYAGTNTALGKQIGLLLSKRSLHWKDGKITFTPWKIWEVFKGRLGWSYPTSVTIFSILALVGMEFFILGIIMVIRKQNLPNDKISEFTYTLITSFLYLSILISPTKILGGEMHNFSCHADVISEHEKAAERISNYVLGDDNVFWLGMNTQSVLLDLMGKREISIYPQQLNAKYSYRVGGDEESLAQYGFWNETLMEKWLKEADVLLIEKEALVDWYENFGMRQNIQDFERVDSISQIGCFGEKAITIYRRKP